MHVAIPSPGPYPGAPVADPAGRLAFLAEASRLLASTLEIDATLAALARLAVPALADWCAVDLIAADGAIRPVPSGIAHADPAKVELAWQLRRLHPIDPDAPAGVGRAVRTGRSELIPEVPEGLLERLARDEAHLKAIRSLGLRSALTVPLVEDGRVLGALTLVAAESGRRFGVDDLALAEELGRRAAVALAHARLHQAEREARKRAEQAASRTARLQEVTAALSRALQPAEVARLAARHAVAALEAQAAVVAELDDDGRELRILEAIGLPVDQVEVFRRFPLAADLPIADAVRRGEAVILESRGARTQAYPHLVQAQAETGGGALVALPFRVEDRCLGGLGVIFPGPRTFDRCDRAFLEALAASCAQALDRARLYAAERAVRARVEDLLQDVEAVVWEVEPRSLTPRFVSRRIEELVGWPAARFVGDPEAWSQLIHPEDRARALEAIRGACPGRAHVVEYRVRTADGRWRWIQERFRSLEGGEGRPRVVRGFTVDVTARKRTEQAQAVLAAAGEILGGSLGDPARFERLAGLMVPTVADWALFSRRREDHTWELGGHAHRDPALAPFVARLPAVRPWGPMTARLLAGQSVLIERFDESDLFANAHADDCERMRSLGIRSVMAVPFGAHGRIHGSLVIGTGEDGRFGGAERALVEELARRTGIAVENARLYEEAHRAIRSRDEVLAIVSHDLRNPLGTIVLNASILERLLPEGSGEVARRQLRAIARSAERMNGLVGALLDAEALANGGLRLEPAPHPAATLVAEAIEGMAPLAAERDLVLEAEATSVATVHCDRDRLLQVFSNLVGNALRFAPAGTRVTLGAATDGPEVRFWVRDRGPGVPAELRDRIFERHLQLRRGPGAGTGLGLHIARGIVAAHGGRIWLEAPDDGGARFVFSLPGAPDQSQARNA